MTGDLTFRNDAAFIIDGIDAGANDVELTSTNTVTEGGVITAGGLSLLGVGGDYDLDTSNHAITTLAGNTGIVDIQDNTGFSIGSLTIDGSTTNGLTTTVNTTLTTTGSVDQTQAIAAATLFLEGGTFDLNDANNVVANLDADNTTLTGDLTFRNDAAFIIDGIDAGANNVELTSTNTVTEGGVITAGGLSLLGVGGDYDLNTSNHVITTLAGNTGNR